MRKLTLNRILLVTALLTLACGAAAQQAYPGKPIRLIVPYAPAGSASILARLVGQKLTESWSQQVIVDNRPGGNTIIGTEAAAKSAPDGYTLLLAPSSHVITPLLAATPYDAIKDFAPVATIASSEYLLLLNPSVPANSLQEFIALAKSKPGQLNYSSAGSGGAAHIAGEMFNLMAGVKMQHIPYKGGGPAVTDLIGGQVQLSFQTPIVSIPHISNGKLKAVAYTGDARLSALPQVPTFTEAGLANFDVKYWFGILAPAGTPRGIIDKLSTEIAKSLGIPDFREKLLGQGMEPFISSPEQLANLMKSDTVRFGKVIKAANIKLEN